MKDQQTSLPLVFGEPNRPSPVIHSKKALEFRIAHIESIVRAGNADYHRAILRESQYRFIAGLKGGDWQFIEGVKFNTAQAKAMLRFIDTWESRRKWYSEEISLVKGYLAKLPE